MRKVQKLSAAVIVAATIASGTTMFSTTVHASGTITAAQQTYICAQIDKAEVRPDLDQYRLPRRRLERALVGYLRQHLARGAVRRHTAARRSAEA